MKHVRRLLSILLITALSIYTVLCGLLFVFQRSLLYYPQPSSGGGGAVSLTLPVGESTVQVSARPVAGSDAVLYFGGNAEDVSLVIPDLALAFPGSSVYALHYPGYGESSGTPTQKAIFRDALAVFDRVHAEHPNVTVIGRSLGSGVAVWVGSQRPIARLVLVTPFDSLGDVAAAHYGIFPVRWLLRDKYESWKYAPEVTAPTVILVAGDDEVVPRSSSDRLRTRFRQGLVDYVVLPHVGHNTIQDASGYWRLLQGE